MKKIIFKQKGFCLQDNGGGLQQPVGHGVSGPSEFEGSCFVLLWWYKRENFHYVKHFLMSKEIYRAKLKND